MFSSRKKTPAIKSAEAAFGYLDSQVLYFDSACQTLRPQQVIDAQIKYFQEYNACGGRAKYKWAEKLDTVIAAARKNVLEYFGKSDREYTVAFTLNTTYGVNLVLHQLPKGRFQRIVTSEIEHNSVFLPTMTAAQKLSIPRTVLKRAEDGALLFEQKDLDHAVVVVNTTSNIDGRKLTNLKEIIAAAHSQGGIILLDGAQSAVHDRKILEKADFDALFVSGHKMYGPSIGIIIIKKELALDLDISLIGGGTVTDVREDSFDLIGAEEPFARLELGLQNFSGIAGLEAAINWIDSYKPEGVSLEEQQEELGRLLFEGLAGMPGVTLLNIAPSPIVSFFPEKMDAHRLALVLSAAQIMARSGYFCCHYYLKNLKKLPPLLRFSLGLHNARDQVRRVLAVLRQILSHA